MPWRKVVPPPEGPLTWLEYFYILIRCTAVAGVLVAVVYAAVRYFPMKL